MKNLIKLATASILVCFAVATFAQAPAPAKTATPAKTSQVADKDKQHDAHWKEDRLNDYETKHPGFKEWLAANPDQAAAAKENPDKALKAYRDQEDAKRAEHKDKKETKATTPSATPSTPK